MRNLKLGGQRVLARRVSAPSISSGGIAIPDSARSDLRPYEVEVVVVGPGKRTKHGAIRPMGLRPGDRVLHNRYAGTKKVVLDGEEYVLLAEDDCVALVEIVADGDSGVIFPDEGALRDDWDL